VHLDTLHHQTGLGYAKRQQTTPQELLLTIIQASQAWQKKACQAPVRDSGPVNRAAGTALFVISTTVLVIRFLARWLIKGTSIGWDDAMIAVAWAGIVPSTVFVDIMIHHGMGRDIWTVDPSGITLMLKLFYYEQYIYQTIIVSTKISIVLLYLRLFPASVSQRFQYVCWGVIAALVAYFLGFVIYFAVECRPIVSSHSPGGVRRKLTKIAVAFLASVGWRARRRMSRRRIRNLHQQRLQHLLRLRRLLPPHPQAHQPASQRHAA
jgi:hypothetical protein